jgi:hypothetical protein
MLGGLLLRDFSIADQTRGFLLLLQFCIANGEGTSNSFAGGPIAVYNPGFPMRVGFCFSTTHLIRNTTFFFYHQAAAVLVHLVPLTINYPQHAVSRSKDGRHDDVCRLGRALHGARADSVPAATDRLGRPRRAWLIHLPPAGHGACVLGPLPDPGHQLNMSARQPLGEHPRPGREVQAQPVHRVQVRVPVQLSHTPSL